MQAEWVCKPRFQHSHIRALRIFFGQEDFTIYLSKPKSPIKCLPFTEKKAFKKFTKKHFSKQRELNGQSEEIYINTICKLPRASIK